MSSDKVADWAEAEALARQIKQEIKEKERTHRVDWRWTQQACG